jgi:DNA-binding NarL/FixJ family response regulator
MPELDLVGEAGSADEGLALAGLESPDLVLLDASIRDGQTNALVAELSRLLPRCRLVLLASLPDPAGLALAMDSGAHGYLLKTSAHEYLLTAIATVLSGGIWIQPELRGPAGSRVTRAVDPAAVQASPAPILTARQVDVLRLVALGLSNAEIAARLFISDETVKTHIAQMLRRLRIRSRVQAARYAIRNGLADA